MDETAPHQGKRGRTSMQAGAVIGLGLALIAMGYTQPAWLGDRIGPGLFAQYRGCLRNILQRARSSWG